MPQASSTKPSKANQPERVKKNRYTLHLPVDLTERAKNASYWTPGPSLAGLAEAGIRAEVDRLEKKHGGAFKGRERELVGGRPRGREVTQFGTPTPYCGC
jgi:hypothetical protein